MKISNDPVLVKDLPRGSTTGNPVGPKGCTGNDGYSPRGPKLEFAGMLLELATDIRKDLGIKPEEEGPIWRRK